MGDSTRRQALRGLGGAALLLALERRFGPRLLAEGAGSPVLAGTAEEAVPFLFDSEAFFEELTGTGLNARRSTDLLRALEKDGVVDASELFVRTGPPPNLPSPEHWRVSVDGRVRRPLELSAQQLRALSSDRGEVVLECAGNARVLGYGLLSSARWDGVELSAILERAGLAEDARAVLVEGYDEHASGSTNSTLGCRWIFSPEALERTGAFLATRVAGEPLPLVNGAPVRLVVPGWYACAAVKWVRRLVVLDDSAPPTPQMVEFAGRTHQPEIPRRALDYLDPVIDLSAVPLRAQRRRRGEERWIAVSGLVWGGEGTAPELEIRFGPDRPWRPVSDPPRRPHAAAWAVWHHRWEPEGPGRYLAQLRPAGRIGTRLGTGHFVRALELG